MTSSNHQAELQNLYSGVQRLITPVNTRLWFIIDAAPGNNLGGCPAAYSYMHDFLPLIVDGVSRRVHNATAVDVRKKINEFCD